jgi:pimeloyl-ACP methyl ester carboxylesterase
MNIVYIHGNAASADSFNFIRMHLAEYNAILLEYDSKNGFHNNYKEMLRKLQGIDDIFFVAHSLGGIYALHLANELPDRVLGAVTMSTPYGGSEEAKFAKYMLPFNQVLRDIHPHSMPIAQANAYKVLHPWINIVSTKGHSPLMIAANDGVVTQDSMRYRRDITLIEVESSHYEIVLSQEAVDIIKKAIGDVGNRIRGVQNAGRPHNRTPIASVFRLACSFFLRRQ